MKLKKIMLLMLCPCLIFAMTVLTSCNKTDSEETDATQTSTDAPTETSKATEKPVPTNKPTEKDDTPSYLKNPDMNKYDLVKYTYPIWEGDICFGETAFVREQEDGTVAPIQLLYDIEEIISVRSADLKTLYKEGEDYEIVDGKIEVIREGKIKVMPFDTYCYEGAKKGNGDFTYGGKYYYWSDMMYNGKAGGGGIVEFDISVTYKHSTDSLPISVPVFDDSKVELFRAKVEDGESIKVVSLGDSITRGCSASANKPGGAWGPGAPAYNEMVCEYIRTAYNVEVNHKNLAVDGQTSTWGLSQVDSVCREKPDLVILAFGANDGDKSPESFALTIKNTVDGIRKKCPDAEFVVVTTCRPNLKFQNANHSLFAPEIVSTFKDYKYVTIADVTKLDIELTGKDQNSGRKQYQDLTGSNSNHPNDYMHRLYAQVVINALFGEYKF